MCVSRGRPGAGRQVPQAHELFEDLAGGQVAHDAVEAAGAEDAAHAAADLRADARRAPRPAPGSARTRSIWSSCSRSEQLVRVVAARPGGVSIAGAERDEVLRQFAAAGRSGRSVICSNDSARPARIRRRTCRRAAPAGRARRTMCAKDLRRLVEERGLMTVGQAVSRFIPGFYTRATASGA